MEQIDQKKLNTISRLAKLNALSLQVHRFLIWFVLVTFLVMGMTGALIRYRWFATAGQFGSVWNVGGLAIEEVSLRKLHSDMSFYFGLFIGIMVITGFAQYFIPKIIIHIHKKT